MRALPWIVALAACGPSSRAAPDAEPDAPCLRSCAADGRAIVDCNDATVETCEATEFCDASSLTCANACATAEQEQRSIGCDYYATSMDVFRHGECFAAIVANTWPAPAHITVRHAGAELAIADFARIPRGSGATLTYDPYDAGAGLPPGEVALLFLGGAPTANAPCPVPAAVTTSSFAGTDVGDAFQITTDVPVVAYQINPYGGGSAVVTGASLLLPTSVWDVDYLAVNAAPEGRAAESGPGSPSLNIIAKEDGTIATITPIAAITGGGAIPPSAAGVPVNITLQKGQHAQLTQAAELTGSTIHANKPIGFMAGQQCMNIPGDQQFCDHAEQMLPPVRALGSTYVAASYRPRTVTETSTSWRVVGVVDGTLLAYSAAVGGPATLNRGESVTFSTSEPFVVSSQDSAHPFVLFAYMSGAATVGGGFGDPDFALVIPPDQYLTRTVFFADPTYPETHLVVVRARGTDGEFHDIELDCLGPITGFTPVGGDHEVARVDLTTGFAPVGACSSGRREMTSPAPFGLWVWGWGSSVTSTPNVSYGYPGGMNVQPINPVIF